MHAEGRSAAGTEFVAGIETVCSEDVVVHDGMIYIADGPAGLRVADVSNPAQPVFIAVIPTTYAFRVYVYSGCLYLCDGPAGLKVFSLEDPLHPAMVWSDDTEWATACDFHSGMLFLGDSFAGFRIYDIADPSRPSFVKIVGISRVRDLTFEGETLLVSDYPYGLATYWFDTADHPACTYTDGSRQCNYEDIVGHDGFAIIARNDEESRLTVYTVGDLARIGIASEYYPSRFIEGLCEWEELLLVACGEDGVVLYGLEDLPALTRIGELDTPGYARRAKAYGSLVYVADMSLVSIYRNPVAGGGAS
jgi:hypothetical protein